MAHVEPLYTMLEFAMLVWFLLSEALIKLQGLSKMGEMHMGTIGPRFLHCICCFTSWVWFSSCVDWKLVDNLRCKKIYARCTQFLTNLVKENWGKFPPTLVMKIARFQTILHVWTTNTSIFPLTDSEASCCGSPHPYRVNQNNRIVHLKMFSLDLFEFGESQYG